MWGMEGLFENIALKQIFMVKKEVVYNKYKHNGFMDSLGVNCSYRKTFN